MDYKHLVDSGEYSLDDLDDKQRLYIGGMKEVEMLLPSFEDYYAQEHNLDDEDLTLNKIHLEILKICLEDLQKYIELTVAQYIVELADENISKNT